MLSTLVNIREIQIKTTMRYQLTLVRMAIVKHSTKNQGWRGCGEMRTLLHLCWNDNSKQPLWRQCVCMLNHFSHAWLFNPVDSSPPGSSVHGILQARILEWSAMTSSRGSSPPRDWSPVSYVSCVGEQVLYHWCHLGSPWRQCGASLDNETWNKIKIFLLT